MAVRGFFTTNNVQLSYNDFGGNGSPLIALAKSWPKRFSTIKQIRDFLKNNNITDNTYFLESVLEEKRDGDLDLMGNILHNLKSC
ncbi:protein of unknown function [Petrocella atlantisensis]|uniref:Uncharacterized protein n=1 Tax=Petrocella atlantisensis TaxID=2173034 RepID=A0A3P7P7J7_9FIRM|nr:hypothetical protein [Petrocella atlantisensis]VDN46193.1 protein of unknown function [Petrocella atlantisensis]